MKQIVGGRKRQIEHFVAKEAGDANHDQDQAAKHDIGSCEDGFHFDGSDIRAARELPHGPRSGAELTARIEVASSAGPRVGSILHGRAEGLKLARQQVGVSAIRSDTRCNHNVAHEPKVKLPEGQVSVLV